MVQPHKIIIAVRGKNVLSQMKAPGKSQAVLLSLRPGTYKEDETK